MLWSKLTFAAGLPAALSAVTGHLFLETGGQQILGEIEPQDFQCELPQVLDPAKDGLPASRDLFDNEKALLKQVERHGTLVKVPSISYDDNGEPGEDPRWNVFFELHATLAKLYPFIHARMTRETVNTFGLVFTINGQDSSLRPVMLTAHQDVVPVADASTWKYPPFSAHFDGRWLWGRGASDDKNSLSAIFSALETLLSNPTWVPRRTIIVALGFDEESGNRGAGTIGPFLEERYGQWSMAIVLDEGGMGLELLEDKVLYALPAVTEKGHIDVWLDLKINGGHSSTPFPHTGIGILSQIVVELEANPYEPKLIKDSPIYNHFTCQAKYSPDAAPKITKLLKDGDLDALAKELATVDRPTQYRIQTSQAIDFFNGGVKINAMPERIRVGVNYRIAPHNTAAEIKETIVELIKPIADKYSLDINAYEGDEDFQVIRPAYDVDYNGTLTLTATSSTANAPVSLTSGAVWDVFSGTIQHSFAFPGGKVVPVGELMTGNTDTRYYLNLTKNVYRWTPTRKGGTQNAHTVDEAIDMHAHIEALKFYYDLIRNFDQSDA
ncbi:vacuolar carboxypeptidase [Seiridium cupressi]